MKIEKLFLAIVMIICFMIPMFSYSKVAYPAEWLSDEGFDMVMNREYQCAAQEAICKRAYPDSFTKQRACYAESCLAYQYIYDYMLDKEGNGYNYDIDICFMQAMEKYWSEEINTTYWTIVFKHIYYCLEE
jgi:hypothetical protein